METNLLEITYASILPEDLPTLSKSLPIFQTYFEQLHQYVPQ